MASRKYNKYSHSKENYGPLGYSLAYFYSLKHNNIKKIWTRFIKTHWVKLSHVLTGWKVIISSDLSQGVLRPIEIVPRNVSDWLKGKHLNIVWPRETKGHWVHPKHLFSMLQCNHLKIVFNKGEPRRIGFDKYTVVLQSIVNSVLYQQQ